MRRYPTFRSSLSNGEVRPPLPPSCLRQRLVVSPKKWSFASELSAVLTGSRQLVEQRLCFFKIWCVEAFGKPAVDRGEEIAGFGAATLVAA